MAEHPVPDLRKLLGMTPLGPPELKRGEVLQGNPDFPGSAGDRERLKFRESEFLRLVQVAVSNDDGSPITIDTDELLRGLLELGAEQRNLLRQLHETLDAFGLRTPNGDVVRVVPTHQGEQVQTHRIESSGVLNIPGIAAADAFDALDAFGGVFQVPAPPKGIIHGLVFHDADNEKIGKTFWLFSEPITGVASDAAFAPTTAELRSVVAVISLGAGDFYAANANAVGLRSGLNLPFIARHERLWCQVRTDSTDSIAGATMPSVLFTYL